MTIAEKLVAIAENSLKLSGTGSTQVIYDQMKRRYGAYPLGVGTYMLKYSKAWSEGNNFKAKLITASSSQYDATTGQSDPSREWKIPDASGNEIPNFVFAIVTISKEYDFTYKTERNVAGFANEDGDGKYHGFIFGTTTDSISLTNLMSDAIFTRHFIIDTLDIGVSIAKTNSSTGDDGGQSGIVDIWKIS